MQPSLRMSDWELPVVQNAVVASATLWPDACAQRGCRRVGSSRPHLIYAIRCPSRPLETSGARSARLQIGLASRLRTRRCRRTRPR
eukprot:scaffold48978_cov33-Tisochrysis_lutea.AAC.6